jgi:hypothetical protein
MEEIVDFASLLMKLVVLLLVVLMAVSMLVMPYWAMALGEAMLYLVAPVFVLSMVLDLAGGAWRFSRVKPPKQGPEPAPRN